MRRSSGIRPPIVPTFEQVKQGKVRGTLTQNVITGRGTSVLSAPLPDTLVHKVQTAIQKKIGQFDPNELTVDQVRYFIIGLRQAGIRCEEV